jgi:hypothetical protein
MFISGRIRVSESAIALPKATSITIHVLRRYNAKCAKLSGSEPQLIDQLSNQYLAIQVGDEAIQV